MERIKNAFNALCGTNVVMTLVDDDNDPFMPPKKQQRTVRRERAPTPPNDVAPTPPNVALSLIEEIKDNRASAKALVLEQNDKRLFAAITNGNVTDTISEIRQIQLFVAKNDEAFMKATEEHLARIKSFDLMKKVFEAEQTAKKNRLNMLLPYLKSLEEENVVAHQGVFTDSQYNNLDEMATPPMENKVMTLPLRGPRGNYKRKT